MCVPLRQAQKESRCLAAGTNTRKSMLQSKSTLIPYHYTVHGVFVIALVAARVCLAGRQAHTNTHTLGSKFRCQDSEENTLQEVRAAELIM